MLKEPTDDQIEKEFYYNWKDKDLDILNKRMEEIIQEFKKINIKEKILHKEAYILKILILRKEASK